MNHFNKLTPAEAERLALLSEELGEAQQAIGKILRHGYASYNPDEERGPNNRESLERELGDVRHAMDRLCAAGDLRSEAIYRRSLIKAVHVVPYLHHQVDSPPLVPTKERAGYGPGTNTGHGHVWSRPDGVKARCGGPGMCEKCSIDRYRYGYGERSARLENGVAYCCACGEPLSAHVNGNCPKHVDPAAEASQPCKTHTNTADTLRALVSEISKTAFHQREQGMREMPDLLESYASRLAAVLTQEGADESVAGKRNAEGYLCYAWGETDLPVALFAADRSGVFRFLVCEWFGDPKDPGLQEAMEQLDSHNFREGPLQWKFEIGGVRIERVYGYEALTTAPDAARERKWFDEGVPSDPNDKPQAGSGS